MADDGLSSQLLSGELKDAEPECALASPQATGSSARASGKL